MTAEQRSSYSLCDARKKSGGRCRKFAGEGTQHLGQGRCKFHGGNTPNHNIRAAKIEAQQKMVQLGAPIDLHPHEALLRMLQLATGHVAWLNTEVGALDDLGTKHAAAVTQLYAEERDRVARVAKAALDAGVAERQVRVIERYGYAIGHLLKGVLEDLDLTAEQQKRAPEIVRRRLIEAENLEVRTDSGKALVRSVA